MPTYNKKSGFAYFGAEQTNERWSWAAMTPKGERVIITLWAHQMMRVDNKPYLDTRELEDDDLEWIDSNGNNERIRLLKNAKNKLDGVVYVLMTRATKPKSNPPWDIESCYPWKSDKGLVHRMKLVFLCEDTGHFRVKYLDTVKKAW